ncbi:DDE-type integrase/transposase/recombinase [Aneurinibacillus aneurinilyticus]|uniref:Integrase catalytic domain-containing protein n=1 Tax=Aneurinibacillus aneurinilyticus ATCC 12856 TaxID=649747 RepID=U1WJW0_ANEAE|nr:DDE-type integrase/transposase/recombinase [Aneurinibacillus aneurinilyticus]ERI08864.1 hypothetical protein HMPREF0083_03052 [Aneurinibacillus aneurinilyticus ATCC 12856]MED0707573.1 DDE-type integrase/transposase/recombinase [Aneurinibacillus aneurinilyticus]MED0723253.1 DDE-type integrase/transposase/recombinase [Aneurinibacillus aneurinilyticus]MED0732925.1 DDE-type integrase/transposase/recombinase [Aneurinibacillus aneurinilyticus]MED0739636.1 DDE-type integrase/transposase/recombinas
MASKPNEKWGTDITYVTTGEGWLYLASVMDRYSRKIIGWHMSDRGSQYASHDYQKQLQVYSMIGGISYKGNC